MQRDTETTIRTYLHGVEHFSRYFHRQPDQLGPEHIRQYQAALFTKFKFSPNTVGLRLATLRFFYIQKTYSVQIMTPRLYLPPKPPPRKPSKWDRASSEAGSLLATRTVTPKEFKSGARQSFNR